MTVKGRDSRLLSWVFQNSLSWRLETLNLDFYCFALDGCGGQSLGLLSTGTNANKISSWFDLCLHLSVQLNVNGMKLYMENQNLIWQGIKFAYGGNGFIWMTGTVKMNVWRISTSNSQWLNNYDHLFFILFSVCTFISCVIDKIMLIFYPYFLTQNSADSSVLDRMGDGGRGAKESWEANVTI